MLWQDVAARGHMGVLAEPHAPNGHKGSFLTD